MDYRKGYKYQLAARELFVLGPMFRFDKPIITEFITLKDGLLHIQKGYAWDGASGPTKDTKNSMRGSCCHDALYQLMRMGLIDNNLWSFADSELYKCLEKDGMSSFRRWYWRKGLKSAKGKHAKPSNRKKIYIAP